MELYGYVTKSAAGGSFLSLILILMLHGISDLLLKYICDYFSYFIYIYSL